MNESTTSHEPGVGLRKRSHPDAELKGVRGWLLALCLMLTLVGPIIVAGLMVHQYTKAAPLTSSPFALQVSVLGSLLLSTCAAAFGAYAGMCLWRLRPDAPTTAKRALLFGLAVDIVTTTVQAITAHDPGDRLLFQVEVHLVPSLIFFTLCFAYLNHSKRVYATYGLS